MRESWNSLPMLALMPELSVRGRRWRWLAVTGFRPVETHRVFKEVELDKSPNRVSVKLRSDQSDSCHKIKLVSV